MRQVLLLLLLSVAVLAAPTNPTPGEVLPDFELRQPDGSPIHLSELSTHTPSGLVCLVWWCSTCASCRKIDAAFDQLHRRLEGKAEVVALVVSAGETPHKVASYKREHHLSFPAYFDPGPMTDRCGVGVTTTALILDKQRQVRYFGRFAEETQTYGAQALDALLAGQPVTHPTTPLFG